MHYRRNIQLLLIALFCFPDLVAGAPLENDSGTTSTAVQQTSRDRNAPADLAGRYVRCQRALGNLDDNSTVWFLSQSILEEGGITHAIIGLVDNICAAAEGLNKIDVNSWWGSDCISAAVTCRIGDELCAIIPRC